MGVNINSVYVVIVFALFRHLSFKEMSCDPHKSQYFIVAFLFVEGISWNNAGKRKFYISFLNFQKLMMKLDISVIKKNYFQFSPRLLAKNIVYYFTLTLQINVKRYFKILSENLKSQFHLINSFVLFCLIFFSL